MPLVAAGFNLRTANIEVRERVNLDDDATRNLLRYLKGHAGLSGVVALNTCHRFELYASCADRQVAMEVAPRVSKYLLPDMPYSAVEKSSTSGSGILSWDDAEAVLHLFRVASGLESVVVGEDQILGQVKSAHRLAHAAETLDAELDILFRRAVTCGKMVRTRFDFGSEYRGLGELSVAAAQHHLGGLRQRRALLIGAGKMSSQVAAALLQHGVQMNIISRGRERAEVLARSAGAEIFDAAQLPEVARAVDLIITSTTARERILSRELVAEVQNLRNNRPLLVIDLAMPRDVAPEAAEIPGVTLLDIDDVANQETSPVHGDLPAIESRVAFEARQAVDLLDERSNTSELIADLLGNAEAIRRSEVAKTLGKLSGNSHLDAGQLETITKSLVTKLLDAPLSHVRSAAHDREALLRVRDVFDLHNKSDTEELEGEAAPASIHVTAHLENHSVGTKSS